MFFFILFFSITTLANDDFESDLLQDLQEVNNIATNTKLNIDDTPSFTTVLDSNKLKKLGVRNLYKAIALIPGVQIKKEASGRVITIFRGFGEAGEIKLLVDGISINNAYRGSMYYYFDFPIELIDRVEVSRGSGSVLYGSGAVAGVINIITKNSQQNSNQLSISAASQDTYTGATSLSTTINDTKLALDGYYTKSNKTAYNGPDTLGNSGDADQRKENFSVGANIEYQDFLFTGRIKQTNEGAGNGIFYVLDNDSENYQHQNQNIFTQLAYNTNLSAHNKISVKAGYLNYKQQLEEQFSYFSSPAVPATLNYKEESYYSQAELISESLDNNKLIVGVKYQNYDLKTIDLKINGTPSPNPLVKASSYRDIYSVYATDNYMISDHLSLSAGLRYDEYSDFGSSIIPAFGAIYRVNESIRLKAKYTNAYRAPSWIELTNNNTLEAEKSNSIEFGFIYKKNINNVFRITAYKTKTENPIKKNGPTYTQEDANNFVGTEAEYTYLPNNTIELSLGASYVLAKDNDGNDLEDVSNYIANGALIYELDSGVIFGSLVKYLSASKRAVGDTRDDFGASVVFNQTITYNIDRYSFSASINDLFDNGTSYPSPKGVAYPNDYNDIGRNFNINASVEF